MHLSECADLFQNPKNSNYIAVACVRDWFLKSTTEFHGWDLNLDYMFGALCWSYSLAGFCMLLFQQSWTEKCKFPYKTFAYMLIFVQGPLSFSADYLSMAEDSNVHIIDRLMALVNFTLQSWKVFTLTFYARPTIFICQLCAIMFAAFCFMNSQESQQIQDRDAFVFWHNAWHSFPLIGILIEGFEFFYLGEYDSSKNGSIAGNVRTASKNFFEMIIQRPIWSDALLEQRDRGYKEKQL